MRNDSSGSLNAPRAETLTRLSEREITGSCKRSSLMNSGHKEVTIGSTDVNVFRSTSKELNFNLGRAHFLIWHRDSSVFLSALWLFNMEVGAKDKCIVFDRMTTMRSVGSYLLVDPAVRGSVVDEDADDGHVSPPGCQVQREASFAVRHICRCLKLQQFENHFPERDIYRSISRSYEGGAWSRAMCSHLESIQCNTVTFPLRMPH